ncbi:MAG: Hsp70 family protein [Deltaproteobacteria bacterium]|nr:Hsp70 family protein [Deltaproteobacteria bacterium]
MSDPRFIVGIDLGTTNSVVAYTEIREDVSEDFSIRTFNIPQIVGPGSLAEQEVLPSFVLVPGAYDVPEGGLSLPWDEDAALAVGEYARSRGAEIPNRLISSSKSWLCHRGVDRRQAILPWGGAEDQRKMSPVEASSAILRHIRDAWNHVMARSDSLLRLENQEIFLTVPASFDVVARDLTVEAAETAGLPRVTLLEEPQAAFYAWIDAERGSWRDRVKVGDVILVVDVGGGTSDFSLIRVTEEKGEMTLERIAVGEHLLVGGDNMDLTLAYALAHRLSSEGRRLNTHQIRGLTHGCRSAKENLLKDETLGSCPVTILGSGSSLIGGTIKTELTRPEIEQTLTNGFFPACDRDAQPQVERRTGMREMGLAYASDPAITRHLAQFLKQQETHETTDLPVRPTAVLFNGGVMKADAIRSRILGIISSWSDRGETTPIREMRNRDFDTAVARGAAYYGLARRGRGIRIRGGLSRAYYIGVEAAIPAVPGMPTPMKALCVAPFGMEEGSETEIPQKEFALVVGEPVKFDFLGSRTRHQDQTGMVVEDWEGDIEEITTLETALEGEEGTLLPVTLQVRVTEVGILELWCVSRDRDKRYKLEFNVRERNG